MIQTVEDFDEATLFERLALDRVHPVPGDESTDEIDLRSPDQHGGVVMHVRLHCSVSADAVNSLATALTPLLFGAAWKTLDRPGRFFVHRLRGLPGLASHAHRPFLVLGGSPVRAACSCWRLIRKSL